MSGRGDTLRRQLRLYLVTDPALAAGRALPDLVDAAVAGGVSCVQLRDKRAQHTELVALARALKARLAPRGVPLVINDRVDVALDCGADGVHLGQGDMAPEEARRRLPPGAFIGWSVETPEHVARSASLPVDYLGVSPIFATPTKPEAAPAWGLEGLRRVRAMTPLPLVAIGGIHPGNAAEVRRAGADGLAVVRALLSAADPAAAARAFEEEGARHG